MIHTLTKTVVDDFDALIDEVEKLCERRSHDALKYIEQAAVMAQQSGDIRQHTLVSYARSYYDCFVAGNYDNAIERLNKTLLQLDEEEFATIGYKPLMTLGNAYQQKGDIFSAQESYLKGLRSLESRAELTIHEQGFLAAFYYNVSVLLSSSELHIASEEYLEKAIAIYIAQDNQFKLSRCYTALAQMLEQKEEYHKAIEFLHLALDIAIQIRDAYSIALSKANLGILSIKVNEYAQSFLYLTDALEYYEENKLAYETGLVKFELGKALIQSGELDDAQRYIDSSEELMRAIDNKKELSEIFQVQSQIHAKRGNLALAYEYLQKYVESIKFFFDSEKNNALARAKKEFESEQKEKEAKLLREKNNEISSYVQKLENSNNELKQFAHAASHDLREPLRMINAYSGLLQKSLSGQLNEQQLEFFGFVMDGSRRMDQLIQDLLGLAKVDANPKMEAVKLNNVIEEIKLNLDALIIEKKAVVFAADLPTIAADRTQMTQLFQNLISNGIKYNVNAVPTVKIHFAIKANHIEIAVADNGTGIPEHLREEAFQIFRRLHKHSQASGSGIGLAICKKIVEAMNGKIQIDNRPGGGSIFKIILPRNAIR